MTGFEPQISGVASDHLKNVLSYVCNNKIFQIDIWST